MPYLALLDDTRVIPPQVDDGETVSCPVCEQPMAVVKSHERGNAFISRHFRHHEQEQRSEISTKSGQVTFDDLATTGECPGESDEHLKMKSIAYARLEHDFPDATVELESGVGDRIADVLVTFNEPCHPYGKGIAVEAQYRNHGKDIEAVTEHYLDREYSVAWLDEADFTEYDVDLSGMLTVWPYAFPSRTGTEGYPDVTRWLWQEKSVSVSMEVPIPGEFWASFDKSGEWVTVAQRRIRKKGRAWVTISRSPTGNLTFQLGKKDWGWNADTHRVTVQLEQSDCAELRSFVETLQPKAFGQESPSEAEREHPWHDLTTAWLAGSPRVTAWLSASLSPDGDVVLSLGKKHPKETDRVTVQVDESVVPALQELTDLLETAFEIESD
ncbi:hypothetical protein [Haloarcula sp. Atlit-120R]|uniref:hypothetical protein n=1 Tax=Haloarcula sp. Atlit-120R TaxID=2282135 RepID=UPI001F305124|nr:hypothetical protein [Haloarcula sp. Atlit-120R]